jgi:hypothetical protein
MFDVDFERPHYSRYFAKASAVVPAKNNTLPAFREAVTGENVGRSKPVLEIIHFAPG